MLNGGQIGVKSRAAAALRMRRITGIWDPEGFRRSQGRVDGGSAGAGALTGKTLQARVAEVPLVRSWPNREHELLHDFLQPEPVCRVIE